MNLRLRRRRVDRNGQMSVVDHLEELRTRILISIGTVVVASIVAYILYPHVLELLLRPLDQSGSIGGVQVEDVYVGGIATAFTLRIKVAAFGGIVLALPVVLFQFWRFITPGLEPREKRYSLPFVLSALVLFAFGAAVAFLLMPVGIKFLLNFVPPAKPLIQLTEYLNFVMLMILGFGISFEFPLVLVFLAAVGLIGSQTLARKRRMAVLLAFLIAAIATPSGDPLSQTLMAVPLYILYEVAILVIRFALKR